MQEIIGKYKSVFFEVPSGLFPDRGVGHTIPLEKDAKPPLCNIYCMSPNELEQAKNQVATHHGKRLDSPQCIFIWCTCPICIRKG